MVRLTLGVALAAAALAGGPRLQAAQPDKRPNLLFIIFDDWGWKHAGAYGCTWVKTPNFERVAREGILFKHCFTSNPKCSPCRASILTGRNTWQLKEACCHFGLFPAGFALYPDLLEQAGYAVGLTGKGWGPGDFRAAWVGASLEVQKRLYQSLEKSAKPTPGRLREILALLALEWIASPDAVQHLAALTRDGKFDPLTEEAAAAQARLQQWAKK
jgi:hypothetical protein